LRSLPVAVTVARARRPAVAVAMTTTAAGSDRHFWLHLHLQKELRGISARGDGGRSDGHQVRVGLQSRHKGIVAIGEGLCVLPTRGGLCVHTSQQKYAPM
jgi:hypothetical protein